MGIKKNYRFELLMYFDGNTLITMAACKKKLLIGETVLRKVIFY
jgi:hypothetical protein